MDKVKLGRSGLKVSPLALGTDLIGSRIPATAAVELFDFYYDHGGNFLDTANFYASWLPGCQGGESETTMGAWMQARGRRTSVVVSSKLGFDYPGCGGGLSAVEIERECEKSLRRLRTDCLDLYYAHRDDTATPLEEVMEAFDRLVRAGKVRAIGASNLPVWRIAQANLLARLNGWTEYVAVEQRYTYLRPRHGADFGPQIFISHELKDFARSHGLALIGYSPLLQGAYTRSDRSVPAQFAGPDADDRLAALRAVAGEVGCTLNQVVLAWMSQGDPPVIPIFGASRIEQLTEDLAALELTLAPEQMTRLNAAGNPVVARAWLQPS
jgi:aryl-alcohol dehydrogenase-like predicted oxidoreductase